MNKSSVNYYTHIYTFTHQAYFIGIEKASKGT